nr:TIGR02281 family clan AA aspartic protease [Stakelama sediminis]
MVVSSLGARRLSFRAIVRNLLGWVIIGGLIFVIVDNRQQLVDLAGRIGLSDQSVQGDTTRIRQSVDGHFWAQVRLNGVERRMLIDSGATMTAISPQTAAAAGVDVSDSGYPVLIETANGTVAARRATVKTMTLGSLKMHDLHVVVAPSFQGLDVIGMNFLSRLGSWRVEKGVLILEPDKSDSD